MCSITKHINSCGNYNRNGVFTPHSYYVFIPEHNPQCTNPRRERDIYTRRTCQLCLPTPSTSNSSIGSF